MSIKHPRHTKHPCVFSQGLALNTFALWSLNLLGRKCSTHSFNHHKSGIGWQVDDDEGPFEYLDNSDNDIDFNIFDE